MKRLVIIILGLMLSSCSVGYYAGSNVGVITTANLSLQPAWGPAGYDCAHYYYFPDFNFYYDVDNALFYYLSGSRWVSARQLPYALGYPRDLYKFYKVVLNIRDPWNHNRVHRREYKHFCGVHTQPVLRDKHPQSRPPQGHRPQYNNNRQPQRPQNNGYAPNDNRNTIRNSRNNNTSRNNVAPQSTPSRNNTTAQKPQGQKPKQNPQTTSGSRSNKEAASGSRSNVKPSQPKQSQSSGTSRSSNDKSNSSGGSRSTGSRGR